MSTQLVASRVVLSSIELVSSLYHRIPVRFWTAELDTHAEYFFFLISCYLQYPEFIMSNGRT
jgi:hypothetical protein